MAAAKLCTVWTLFCVVLVHATIPDSEPMDDSNPDGTPLFIQEPELHYYIVKAKPVTITCKAAPAVQISFKCAGQWVRPKYQVNMEQIDLDSGVKYLQSSIDVSKEEVEEVGAAEDGYWCECHAWSNQGSEEGSAPMAPQSALSRRGLVQIASLKKRFEREPLSASVELEDTIQLQCLPPEGLPMPQVFWLKDGVEIDRSDQRHIISSEGNLIISLARLTDTANYTCGAQNEAGRRLSESATLTVYVNGGWSTWSSWNECSSRCKNDFKRRTRTCDNPYPVNGQQCFGDAVQRVNCTANCPEGFDDAIEGDQSDGEVHGLWSTWSSWSTCGEDCRQHRARVCDNPEPARGGRRCMGSDLETANCSDGGCPVPIDTKVNDDGAVTNEIADKNIAMYVGLIAGVTLFITIGVILILILKRRFHHAGWCFSGTNNKKFNKNSHDLLRGHQPDLTQTVVTIQNHHTLEKPNNNHLNGGLEANGTMHSIQRNDTLPHNGSVHNSSIDKDSEHIYSNIDTLVKNGSMRKSLQMLLGDSATANGNVSEHTGLLSDSKLSDCETRPNSLYSACSPNNREGALSVQLPPSVDVEAMAFAEVNHLGGRLSLPESGVSVTIPNGAIAKGVTQEMYLAVCRDDKDRPKLNDSQTILGPVIMLGPQGLALKKPVILSLQHCASIKHGQWCLSVYNSDSPYDEPPQWLCATTLGQETINTPVYTQIDQNQCHIMTDCLQRYTLVGEPNMARKAIKILRLAVFAPTLPSALDYNARVYFLEDTRDAFEHVRCVEHKLGGRLVSDKPKQILFQYGGGNLCLTVDELSEGWRCKSGTHHQDIPFFHIWSGTQNGLHCSFALERLDRSQHQLAATIHVFQKEQTNNKQTLQISCNLNEPLAVNPSPAHLVNSPHHYHNTTVTGSGFVNLDPPNTVFRLPIAVKQQLGQVLDPPNARGNDWRMLAQRLSVDRYINYFATKTNPTEHILDLWEARHKEDSAITDLMNSLRAMGRTDAAAILEQEFQSWL